MHIHRYDEVPILFMLELAQNYGQRNIPLSYIATKHGLSVLFLKKIVRQLIKAKLVYSKEGVNGGYILSRLPDQITLWDIISAYNIGDKQMMQSESVCPIRTVCLPQRVNLGINQALKSGFSELTLAQLGRKDILYDK
jgi:Rrf2 family protein